VRAAPGLGTSLRNRPDMARKPSRTLTEAEYRLMDVLWDKGTATVADIHGVLGEPPIAYTTALSTLTILERKGFVKHKTVGKANVYRPVIDRDAARRSHYRTAKSARRSRAGRCQRHERDHRWAAAGGAYCRDG